VIHHAFVRNHRRAETTGKRRSALRSADAEAIMLTLGMVALIALAHALAYTVH
jgi:hypothetical protein